MDWVQITFDALKETWEAILMFLPKLIGAIVVFIIGWFVALFIGKIISEILKRLKLDRAFERTGWQEALEKAEIKISPSTFIGEICKWILVIVFLMIATDILKLTAFKELLLEIINWLPNLVVAIAIFVVAIIIADILEKIVKASTKKMKIGFSGFLGSLTKGVIYFFAIVAILGQLKIEMAKWIVDILEIVVGGAVLAAAIAFGLGGKDAASKLIEEIKKKISEK